MVSIAAYKNTSSAENGVSASGEVQALRLMKMQDDVYGWVMPYHNAYYDRYFCLVYGLPSDTKNYLAAALPLTGHGCFL